MLKIETIAACTPGHPRFRRLSLKIGRVTISLNRWTLAITREQTQNTRHIMVVIGWASSIVTQRGFRPSLTLANWETRDGDPLRYEALSMGFRPVARGRRVVYALVDNRGLITN